MAQAVGVADARMAPVMAGVLADRGASALVFRGDDGLDELSTATTSRVWAVADGHVREEQLDPFALGLAASAADALRGADAAHNAAVARRLVDGEAGPVRDAVLLNAAAALAAYDGVSAAPVGEQIGALLPRAAESIDSGAAAELLERWVAVSQSLRA
jgi:anthranilate phosphoribosyltransferase